MTSPRHESHKKKHKKRKKKNSIIPAAIQEIRDKVSIESDAPKHTASISNSDAFSIFNTNRTRTKSGKSNADNDLNLMTDANDNTNTSSNKLQTEMDFDLHSFFNQNGNFSIKVNEINEKERFMSFDMIGIETPMANALRRILLSELPTMAIEDCCVLQNTSIVMDEVLCHRLGLVPIACDPRLFSYVLDPTRNPSESRNAWTYKHGHSPSNTLVFKLRVSCTVNPASTSALDPPHLRYLHSTVYSSDIEWVPQRGQTQLLSAQNHAMPIRAVHPDIILAKLRPGQSIEVSMKAVKGIGKTHAKYSPVGTAFYRLLPHIQVLDDAPDDSNGTRMSVADIEAIHAICPRNVFDIVGGDDEDVNGNGNASKQLVARRPRDCSLCRACIADDITTDRIKISRLKSHFIFNIESIGQYPSVTDLFFEAILILQNKCKALLQGIHDMNEREIRMNALDEEQNYDYQDID